MKTADQLASKISAIKGSEDYDSNVIRNRAMVTGASIGGVFGLYYGYTRKKNMLVMSGAGIVLGAIMSRLLMPKD